MSILLALAAAPARSPTDFEAVVALFTGLALLVGVFASALAAFAAVLLPALALLAPFYLLPTIIAWMRRHRHPIQILLLNLFLGWTIVGWVIAMLWAALGRRLTSDKVG